MLSYEELYEKYATDVLRVSYFYLGDRQRAEDVCQDVFVRLMTNAPDLQEGREKAWLLKVALNRCRDLWRGAWLKRVVLGSPMFEMIPAPDDSGQRDDEEAMMKAIHDLVPDYRDSLTEAIEAIGEDESCKVPAHFDTLPNLSLDYSILEKSENVYVKVCDFGWADLGSWCSLHNDTQHDKQDNVLLRTEALLYNSEGNVICLPEGRIAVIDGLKGFVVAEKGNVLMICPKDDSAALRRMMTDAQMKLGEEFI